MGRARLSDPAPRRRSRAWPVALAGLLVAASTYVAEREMASLGRFGDERHHLRQIESFCEGRLEVYGKLTTIPGYHALAALLGRALGECSLSVARGLNTALGLLSVAFFLLAAIRAGTDRPIARSLQYYFLPILLPYYFLAYTDVSSAVLILFSLFMLLSRRPVGAGMVGSASLLFRQSNVAWLVFVCLYLLVEQRLPADWRGRAGGYLRRAWPSLLGIAAFLAFLVYNGSVVLGERKAHQLGFHTANPFFALFCYAVVFAPSLAFRLWKQRGRLGERRLLGLLTVGFVLYLTTFDGGHPYNQFDGFLRNDLLKAMDHQLSIRLAFYVPVALAIAGLFLTRLRGPAGFAVYPFTLLLLLPSWLVEPRYYVVPFVLLLLFREDDPPLVEGLAVSWSAALSGLLLFGISAGRFGL
jgi:alpha-1,2-glucosyltransferase